MMQQENAQIEYQRHQLLTTLGQAADALRNAAAMAESFAALVQHSAFVPQLPGHPLSMFQMFAPPGQGQGQMQPFQTSIAPMTPGVAPTAPAEGSNGRKRGARNATPADEDAVGADGKKKRKRAPAGEKKEKKVRDPNAPKRPPSAYLLFQNEVRKEMQARYPDKPYHEVLTRISERWSKMNDDDKKVYNDMTNENKIQFAVRKAAYDASLSGTNGTASADIVSPTLPAPVAAPAPAPVVAPVLAPEPVAQESDTDEEEASESPSPVVAAPGAVVAASSTDDSSSSSSEEESDAEEAAPAPAPKRAKVQKPAAPAPAVAPTSPLTRKTPVAATAAPPQPKERKKREKKSKKEVAAAA